MSILTSCSENCIPVDICQRLPMKKLFALISPIAALMPLSTQAQQSSGTLAGFLSGQGLAGAKLERRFGNHLFARVSINNKRAALMIDTGTPIDKDSATTFGLKVENTARNVGGVFGGRWENTDISSPSLDRISPQLASQAGH